jgi:hypothetical protein
MHWNSRLENALQKHLIFLYIEYYKSKYIAQIIYN